MPAVHAENSRDSKVLWLALICGLLAAFLYVQNQQLQQAADQLAAISLERTDTSPPGFAEVIARAALQL